MSHNPPSTVTILGAGPAGLGAGFYARQAGMDLRIFEANDQVGGNSRTLTLGPYRFDTGAHRLHDKDAKVTSDLKHLLGDDLRRIEVPSQIYWEGSYIDFPLSPYDLLTKLDLETLFQVTREKIRRLLRTSTDPDHFEEMARQAYGPTLAAMFLLNYSRKLWGKPTDQLALQIAGGRLQGLDLKTFLLETLLGKYAKTRHLDGSFYYPRYGFGTIFEAVADAIGRDRIHCRSPVTSLVHDEQSIAEIIVDEERSVEPTNVISTLPVTVMIELLKPRPPMPVQNIAETIQFRHLRLLVLAIDRPQISPNASIYFPSENFSFTRLYEPKNRSSAMAPEDTTAVVVEIPAFSEDRQWRIPDHRLKNEIVRALVRTDLMAPEEVLQWRSYRLSYAYPVLDTAYPEKIARLRDYLSSFENLVVIGRSAQFQYTHTHDLFAAAHKTIDQMRDSGST